MVADIELGTLGVGFGVGLLMTIFVWAGNARSQFAKQREIEDLKKHLHTNMNIQAKGYEEIQQQVEKLKQENENLRITLATLSNKPGRAELKILHTWDKAVKLLTMKSPAFAPAWELAVDEARKEIDEADMGARSLVRKVFALFPQEPQRDS